MKKFFIAALLTVFSFSTLSTGYARAAQPMVTENSDINVEDYTVDDILALEPYVYVENGLFNLNIEEARDAGIDEVLISGQQEYFDLLNQQATNGIITVSNDLTIQDNNQVQAHSGGISLFASCQGVTTNPVKYWWGYKTKLNNCDTKKAASNASSTAAAGAVTSAGLGTLAILFPVLAAGGMATLITSSWLWLFAERLNANNKGKGVIVEMTWAAVFDITPQ